MKVTIEVKRFDPESGKGPYLKSYQADVPENAMVLDALIQIREEQDGTLALRCSCRSSICGSCAMEINGRPKLACKTKVSEMAKKKGKLQVGPGGNLPVIKDLIVDMAPFWEKIRAIEPWLKPEGPEPKGEYLVPNESMLDLAGAMNCIMCGACVMACEVMEVDKSWLAPAALAKAYRFVGDPRDGKSRERLKNYSKPGGIWECTHCFECVEVCPKGVAPMEKILAIREKAMEAGLTQNAGSRHSKAFSDSVKHSGWLNEATLPVFSIGFNLKELFAMIPLGFRMLKRRKMPSPFHKPIPNSEKVRRLFERFEKK